jgi:hypothetical protein
VHRFSVLVFINGDPISELWGNFFTQQAKRTLFNTGARFLEKKSKR